MAKNLKNFEFHSKSPYSETLKNIKSVLIKNTVVYKRINKINASYF